MPPLTIYAHSQSHAVAYANSSSHDRSLLASAREVPGTLYWRVRDLAHCRSYWIWHKYESDEIISSVQE